MDLEYKKIECKETEQRNVYGIYVLRKLVMYPEGKTVIKARINPDSPLG